jgi:DNA-binding beta-propeller fold protein YncE
VEVGKNGKVYVLDGVNNKVKVFNSKGSSLFSFGGAGQGNGKFTFPLGIYLDEEDRVYVADSGNHRVQVFSPDGTYLYQFTTETGKKGFKPSDPTDVVVNSTIKRCYFP